MVDPVLSAHPVDPAGRSGQPRSGEKKLAVVETRGPQPPNTGSPGWARRSALGSRPRLVVHGRFAGAVPCKPGRADRSIEPWVPADGPDSASPHFPRSARRDLASSATSRAFGNSPAESGRVSRVKNIRRLTEPTEFFYGPLGRAVEVTVPVEDVRVPTALD